jgi:hypothetical protein
MTSDFVWMLVLDVCWFGSRVLLTLLAGLFWPLTIWQMRETARAAYDSPTRIRRPGLRMVASRLNNLVGSGQKIRWKGKSKEQFFFWQWRYPIVAVDGNSDHSGKMTPVVTLWDWLRASWLTTFQGFQAVSATTDLVKAAPVSACTWNRILAMQRKDHLQPATRNWILV